MGHHVTNTARLSGQINEKGQMASNTSDHSMGWTSEIVGPGSIKVTFEGIYTHKPNVLANVINAAAGNIYSVNVSPIQQDYVVITVQQLGVGPVHTGISFAAFGIIAETSI
jgi:hypothetical protein